MSYQSKSYVCDRPEVMQSAVNLFLNKTKRKRRFGNFRVSADRIEYQSTVYNPEVIAVRIQRDNQPELVLGNSSVLGTIGVHSYYGHTRMNRTQTVIQEVLSKHIPMLPFSVFKETGLDIREIELVEQAPSETVNRKFEEKDADGNPKEIIKPTHFTGASLFKLGESYYLFDIDRNEIEHAIFNPFVAQLPRAVKTIAEAYASLKPKQVKDAERNGLKVMRQGEWFFIPTDKKLFKSDEVSRVASVCRSRWGEMDETALKVVEITKGTQFRAKVEAKIKSGTLPIRYELRAGQNRPNHASMGLSKDKVHYVSGIVSHSGREHADLNLGSKWHIAVPNTATKSFTISGDVD